MSGPWEKFSGPWQQFDQSRTQGGLYHFQSPDGYETFSRNAPPAGSTPYAPPDPSKAVSDDHFLSGWNNASERLLAGIGKDYSDAGLAIRQIFEPHDNLSSLIAPSPLQVQAQEVRNLDAPLTNSTAGKVGQAVPYLVAAPASLPGALAVGGLSGALQPTVEGESRTRNVLTNAAVAGGANVATRLIGAVARPIVNNLSPTEQAAVETLTKADVPLTVAQRTGSPFLTRMQSIMKDSPLTVGQAERASDASQQGWQRAVLSTIGEDAPAATKDVMRRASERIGGVFNGAAARNPVTFDTDFASALQDVQRNASRTLTDDQYSLVARHLSDILDAARKGGGVIDGTAFSKIYSGLGKATSSPILGESARDLRTALQDALERSATDPADIAAIRTARNQWQAMRQIEPAIANDGSGNISVLKLSNLLGNARNRSQSVFGRGNQDLVDIAQAGRAILPDTLANSGSTARLLAAKTPGLLGNAVIDLVRGEPVAAAKTVSLGASQKAFAPLVFAKGQLADYLSEGIQNPYLRSLMLSPTTPGGRIATQAGARQLAQLLEGQ